MPHVSKEYFEGHYAQPLFEECAQYLGVDLSLWEFSSGAEGEAELEDGSHMEYLSVVYGSLNDERFTLYAVFICIDYGEWELQQFGTNQERN